MLFRSPARMASLSPAARAVVQARVLDERGWIATAAAAGLPVPAAMRQLRRAIRALLVEADVSDAP